MTDSDETGTGERLVAELEALGVEYVFGYPGGRVIEVLDHLPDSEIDLVRPRDEREASVMAEMHGRLTGDPGVLVGQGPWIGSLGVIGQMEARLGSSPKPPSEATTPPSRRTSSPAATTAASNCRRFSTR